MSDSISFDAILSGMERKRQIDKVSDYRIRFKEFLDGRYKFELPPDSLSRQDLNRSDTDHSYVCRSGVLIIIINLLDILSRDKDVPLEAEDREKLLHSARNIMKMARPATPENTATDATHTAEEKHERELGQTIELNKNNDQENKFSSINNLQGKKLTEEDMGFIKSSIESAVKILDKTALKLAQEDA